MLIDLHIHTRRGSSCSRLQTKDLMKQAKAMGLDAVCITDHNTTREVKRLKKAGADYGLLVFGGMEVRCLEGDVLTFGLWDVPPAGIPARALVELAHSKGAVAIPAHPFRASAPSLKDKVFEIKGFDALEILNGNSNAAENWKAQEAALKLGLPGTGGSDSHSKKSVGKYATDFEESSLGDETDLIAAIKTGRYHPRRVLNDDNKQ